MAVYSIRNDFDSNNNIKYFGQAVPGSPTSAAVWQIMQVTYNSTGDVATSLWADGNTAFDNVWDNRAGLSYS